MLLHVGDNSFQQERGSSNVCREEVRFQTTENKLYQESNPNTGEKHTKEMWHQFTKHNKNND